ncbi:MAG: E3 binding domain-containing protein [Chloroflexus sp.]|uniref:E3 binding domain-containing protein n=1 Tax=Chloroflexus sp. TaxID=1904827 RepID=UPI003D1135F9
MQTQTITLPAALGEATLLEWLATVGETVTPTTPLVRVLTADAEWAVPAQVAGVLVEQLASAGARLSGGAALAHYAPPRQVRATPLARRIAGALGIDLATLNGSGPGGRIGRADVLAAAGMLVETAAAPAVNVSTLTVASAPVVQPVASDNGSVQMPPMPTETVATLSQVVMSDGVPLASVTIAVNLQPLMQRCAAQAAEFATRGLQATPLSALVAATAALFPLHPLLNAAWAETAIMLRHRYHTAVSLSDGRWVLIRDAGDLTERGIARMLARTDTTNDLAEATFSIVATTGWWRFASPLPGTAAALTLSEAQRQPIAFNATTLVVGAVAQLSLCYDARILDHLAAMAFLRDLCRQLGVEALAVASSCTDPNR